MGKFSNDCFDHTALVDGDVVVRIDYDVETKVGERGIGPHIEC